MVAAVAEFAEPCFVWNDSLQAVIFPHFLLKLTTCLHYLRGSACMKVGDEYLCFAFLSL